MLLAGSISHTSTQYMDLVEIFNISLGLSTICLLILVGVKLQRLDNGGSGANYHLFTTFYTCHLHRTEITSSSFYSSLQPLDLTALT